MYYLWALSIIILAALLFLLAGKNKKQENSDWDVPVININKDTLEKSAGDIENFKCRSGKTYLNRKAVIKNLDKSYKKIVHSYKYISRETKNKRDVINCAQWLLDNFYLIDKEYKEIKAGMPESYYKNLPVIKNGIYKGMPRIYVIALEIVRQSDGRVDDKTVGTFINAYQKYTVLTIGELWAVPIMIRTALIEKIAITAQGIVFAEQEINKGELAAEKIINAVYDGSIELVINELSRDKNLDYNSHFISRLLKILRDNFVENSSVYAWIEKELELRDSSVEKIVNLEYQKQASCEILMGNCITGIREAANLNWKESFEKYSLVEQILREDPYGLYTIMDFQSRDYYRHSIEKIARRTKLSEVFIAKKCIECAKEACADDHKKHAGYYLVDEGIEILKEKLGCRKSPAIISGFSGKKHTAALYLILITAATAILSLILTLINYADYPGYSIWDFVLAFLAVIIPCSEIIIPTFNWSLNYLFAPRFIPKVEFKEGIPEECSTVVVIPALLESEDVVRKLIADMEVYYMANREINLYFALLGDFKDSQYETCEQDGSLVNTAMDEIKRLNAKYCMPGGEIFYFLNRCRQYNETQGAFMGWERKRGKLMEFNRLLRGDMNTSYTIISSSLDKLKRAKYVITLDSDTKLPMNSARKLIGAMHHVLNRAVLDTAGRVIRGHGLMQPRISISTISADKTVFSRLFSGEAGIDIYSTAISDVYEDLFDEGIYTGKGIYDLDVFMKVLNNEIPENLVLSHDLLEGSYTRAALITDVEFIDNYPAYYNSFSKRLHRWVRGDWQIISWIYKKSQLNILSRWKILDNLRRSLAAPAAFLLIVLALSILPGEGEWMLVAFASIISPILFGVSEGIILKSGHSTIKEKLRSTEIIFEKVFLAFSFLPYKAYLMVDAVIRTLYRLKISKKNLLEWQTAENAEFHCGKSLFNYIVTMNSSIGAGLIIFIIALGRGAGTALMMLPYCIIWIVSPVTAYIISIDKESSETAVNKEQEYLIRRIARKTWAYFEDFVAEEDHWLAPDNYQEYPANGLAHRTSPTNLGMGLITNICAYDLGYIGIKELAERLENILGNMKKLQKYKGHFFNWYNTKSLEPLEPKYISTVDSGNLAGYLWVISESLKEYSMGNKINDNLASGLVDILKLAQEEIKNELSLDEYYIDFIEKFENNAIDSDEVIKNLIKKCEFILNEKRHMYWNGKLKKILSNILDEIKIKDSIYEWEKLKMKMESLQKTVEEMADSTDFTLLYDKNRQLFSIGYDVDKGCISNCYYDLLASESRQASFVAVAKGDVDPGHWFKLGRTMGRYGRSKGLISWSGTMFEYCMPLLIMRNFPETLLSETYKAVVREQMEYSRGKCGFWGISESAFYNFDISMNYQYKAFGVPDTALKRGVSSELVVSPYSTLLALMVNLKDSIANIESMIKNGVEGRYGFYEALDYTRYRIPKGSSYVLIRSYMVHHQGMGLMAMHNVLKSNILQKRFHNIPRVKASELLLQEKMPKTAVYSREDKFEAVSETKDYKIIPRKYDKIFTDNPKVNLISNGEYSLMVTSLGGGYSKLEDTMINRWKEDAVSDCYGMFFYIKNLNSGDYWSSAFEPSRVEPDKYEVTFLEGKAQYERVDGNITTRTEIIVSQEDNAELRKITLVNHGESTRDVEITSYFEVTITKMDADIVHPGFSNLFINTEHVEDPDCIIASRRPRAKNDKKNWIMHTLAVEGEKIGSLSWETSRADFVGRCGSLERPRAMQDEAPLKNSTGAVLDPVLSLRTRIRIPKGESCTVYFSTGISDSRERAIELAGKYSDMHNITRAFDLSWTHSIIELKYMGIKSPMANLFQEFASYILYINDSIKEREGLLKNLKKSQPALWCYGISGDIPIVTVLLWGREHMENVRQVLMAHEYLSKKALKFDLVIINNEESSYVQHLQDSLRELADSGYARDKQNKPGGIFILNRSTACEEDINMIQAISRFVINCSEGSLLWKISHVKKPAANTEKLKINKADYKFEEYSFGELNLQYFNGLGGFNNKNKSYVILLKNRKNTPAPWINVISNGKFGFQVSENGTSYTWNKNSRENKLTLWSNDPVMDQLSEALYLRDEAYGWKWGISPKPFRDNGEYIVEHGFGYSSFKHYSRGIAGEMTMFTPVEHPVKIIKVKLKNMSNEERFISLTYYARIVLGVTPEKTSQYIFSKYIKDNEYIYAENKFSQHFKSEKCYLKIIGGTDTSYTGDRKEFIGKGTADNPEAMERTRLSYNAGAGYDPCLAANSKIKIDINEEKEILILLGQEQEKLIIQSVISKYDNSEKVNEALEKVKAYWNDLTDTIQVNTPDKTMDIMLNGWLIYQTLSCRIWARTAFYQSGGAYGFRDQLQDVMAVSYLDPEIARKHILYSASRQFKEGDVQHWWHPVIESGIRTRFSDDLLWLPYVVEDYIKNTGDYSILNETASYLSDKPLATGEDERYSIPEKSGESGPIYEHCIKALNRSLQYGKHNIPLMGSGDWNDGFSSVGNNGEGESVWLGWFLYKILEDFIPLCMAMKDQESIKKYTAEKNFIIFNLEKNAWDGDWYRRAYFDDGTVLGSIQNDECQIDSIAQNWAVISGGAKESRVNISMESLEKYLIKEDKGLIVLFSPPFDKTKMEPGYIKGYLPGVRENGGQYTHAAVWTVIAMAKLGYGNKAWKLFNMLNQINHTKTNLECEIYKTEPYVISADVYTVANQVGRGGWSWYTGAAGWMYRAGVEWILGLKLQGKEGFKVEPCIPEDWNKFNIKYKKGKCIYHINVSRGFKKGTYLNGNNIESGIVPFFEKGEFEIEVII